MVDETRDERSLGQLFGDLTRQLSTLVRAELDLARAEVTSKAGVVGRDAALVGAGGALVHAGFLALMAAVALLLVEVGLEAWISALLVGVVVAAIGGFLVQRGRTELQQIDLAPKRTMETLKDDAEWAKEQVR
jgi:hypothetical protein